jgi:hypothetical protein
MLSAETATSRLTVADLVCDFVVRRILSSDEASGCGARRRTLVLSHAPAPRSRRFERDGLAARARHAGSRLQSALHSHHSLHFVLSIEGDLRVRTSPLGRWANAAGVLTSVQSHPASRVDELLPHNWTPSRPKPDGRGVASPLEGDRSRARLSLVHVPVRRRPHFRPTAHICGGLQLCGSSSSIREAGWVCTRSRTSAR